MSSSTGWTEICDCERTSILDTGNFCKVSASAVLSPIDAFYANQQALVTLGTFKKLAGNEALGRLLLLGIVSATENYFRTALAGLVHVCPLAHKHAAVQMLSFGSVEYYPPEDLGLALLEHHTFLSAKDISGQTERLTKLDLKKDPSAWAALTEYEKLCQFRHAAVHSHGALALMNIHNLSIESPGNRLSIAVDFGGFQEAVAICVNAVRGFNRFAYRETVDRWMKKSVISGDWKADKLKMDPLFQLFRSRNDSVRMRSALNSYQKLLPLLKKIRVGTVRAI